MAACFRPRALLAVTALAVAAGPGATALGGPPAVGPAAAPPPIWKLVATTCDEHAQPPQVAVGLGCWDQQATDRAHWTVTSENATWNQGTFTTGYTYHVPSEVKIEGSVSLATSADDLTNGSGTDTQVCVISQFTVHPLGGGDPCARAVAPGPGTSNSGSKTVYLVSAGTPTNADCPVRGFGCATVTIGVGDGGHVIFTYKQMAGPRTNVKYSFSGGFSHNRADPRIALSMHGSGSLDMAGDYPLLNSHTPFDIHGSAVIEVHDKGSARAGRIVLSATGASFGTENSAVVHYVVTRSSSSCERAGELESFSISHSSRRDQIFFSRVCGATKPEFKHQTEKVSVKVANVTH